MKIRKIFFYIIIALLIFIFLWSTYMIVQDVWSKKQDSDNFSRLAELINTDQPDPDEFDFSSGSENTVSGKSKRNLSALFAMNSDCIGWLNIPGTELDYPVMHTPEEPERYLHKNFDGKYSKSGVLFLDSRCDIHSDNLIVYGHNMRNGSMFGRLPKYTDSVYCMEHPVIEWETAEGCDVYTVFSVVRTDIYDPWYYFVYAQNEQDFNNQVEQIKSQSLYDTGVTPKYGQRIITLSTCYGSSKNDRLLVIAVKQD